MLVNKLKSWKTVAVVGLLVLAVLSITVFSPWFSSPKAYPETMKMLDRQKEKVMTMNVLLTGASTAVSFLDEDIGTPIATELADLTTPLFIILCILYAEKFLLTTLAWIAFTIVLPLTCLLAAFYVYLEKKILLSWLKKLVVLVVALSLLVPFSAATTIRIEETFSESINQTFEKADQIGQLTERANEDQSAFVAFFSNLKDNMASLLEMGKTILSSMVDAVAVLMITSCVVPILTTFLFLWVVRYVTNLNIPFQKLALMMSPKRRRLCDDGEELEEE